MQIYFNIRDISSSKPSLADDDMNEEKSRKTSGDGVFEQIIQVLGPSFLCLLALVTVVEVILYYY